MTAAIFGLVGVIVGGLLTGAVDSWNDRRNRKAELRQAKRLVAEDLRLLYENLRWAAQNGSWSVESERLQTDAWSAYRAILARELSDEQWSDLASLFSTVPAIRGLAAAQRQEQLGQDDIDEAREGAEHCAAMYAQLTGARPVDP